MFAAILHHGSWGTGPVVWRESPARQIEDIVRCNHDRSIRKAQGQPLRVWDGHVDAVSMARESSDDVEYLREDLPTETLDAVHRQFLNQLGRCGCGKPLVGEDGVLHGSSVKLTCAQCFAEVAD